MAINISGFTPNYSAAYPTLQSPTGKTANAEALYTPGTKDNEETGKAERYGIKNPHEECETCKNRKYQDGSDEHNVSFKTASHISPNAAGAAVRAHENQHVSNAYKKAESNNGKVINASVSIHTSICPECGRSYVSGGTTRTQIKYYNEENPYQQDLKATDGVKYRGMNVNLTA